MTTNKKIIFVIPIIAFALFIFPLIQAVSLTDTIINNTESNVTIIIGSVQTIYFDTLIIADDGSIYFEKLRSSDTTTESITFNITTEANITIYGSPIWFSSSSDTSKHIASNLSEGINVSVVVDVEDCDTVGDISYTPDGGVAIIPSYTCEDGVMTLTNLLVNPATASNVLSIVYNGYTRSSETNSLSALSKIIKGLGLMAFAVILVLVILIVKGSVDGSLGNIFEGDTPALLLKIMFAIIFGVLVVSVISSLFA